MEISTTHRSTGWALRKSSASTALATSPAMAMPQDSQETEETQTFALQLVVINDQNLIHGGSPFFCMGSSRQTSVPLPGSL